MRVQINRNARIENSVKIPVMHGDIVTLTVAAAAAAAAARVAVGKAWGTADDQTRSAMARAGGADTMNSLRSRL